MIHRGEGIDLWQRSCSSLLVILLFGSGCATHRLPIPGVSPPSEDEETKIAREFRREAKKELKIVTNPEVERYIDRIGQRILAVMGPQPYNYRFFVVDDSQLNAFAVPGGSIYFFTGLLEKAERTAEIAGVMAHEIVHVKGHHMARSAGPDAVSLLGLLGMLLLARTGSGAEAAGMVSQAIAATRQIAFSRQLEMEADTLGARYMSMAGYDPKGVLEFLQILNRERSLNPVDLPPYMMTHPVTQERVANIELVIRSLRKNETRAKSADLLKKVQLIIRLERQETDEVLKEYRKLVAQTPDDGEAVHLLAYVQHYNGQLAQAKKNYLKAQKLEPKNPDVSRDLGRLYTQMGDFGLARGEYEHALALEPKEPLNYLYLGEMFEKKGDLRLAAGAYLNAFQLAPLWDKPPQHLGTVYGKLGRMGDAYYYLGRSLLLQDEDEKAFAYFEKAIKILGEGTPRGQSVKDELSILRAQRR
jgi:predicted Zn-dependent protease